MEYFPHPLSRAESDALAVRIGEEMSANGFGLWAVQHPSHESMMGFVGLTPVSPKLPIASAQEPPIEVSWRLARQWWGQGYATEAARAAIACGFGRHRLTEIVSMTAVVNQRSINVMERVGMTHETRDDFDHPALDRDHRLRRHVLYRLKNNALVATT